jgi:group I intron endonuclease
MGYIYKITNTVSKKCYIGETTNANPEERWKGHKYTFTKNKGCPALRDAVNKYGIDKFTFEVLIICFDEDRYIYEKEYIKKYNSVVPNGYNILEGGAGGGFKGKSHSEETKNILRKRMAEYYTNPENIERLKDNTINQMKKVKESGIDWGNKVKMSEKYKKAIEDGCVGGKGHVGGDGHLEKETKDKISESLKVYYSKTSKENKNNIENHRKAMAKSVGVCVDKYTKEGLFIKSYLSISEAARENGIVKNSIQQCIDNPNRSSAGFIWRRKFTNEVVTV